MMHDGDLKTETGLAGAARSGGAECMQYHSIRQVHESISQYIRHLSAAFSVQRVVQSSPDHVPPDTYRWINR
jgi:hypothetical protein